MNKYIFSALAKFMYMHTLLSNYYTGTKLMSDHVICFAPFRPFVYSISQGSCVVVPLVATGAD